MAVADDQRAVRRLRRRSVGVAATPDADAGAEPEIEVLRAENARLRDALAVGLAIEQAKGVVMARSGCDPDEAFQVLCRGARRRGSTVRDLAVAVVGSRGVLVDALAHSAEPSSNPRRPRGSAAVIALPTRATVDRPSAD